MRLKADTLFTPHTHDEIVFVTVHKEYHDPGYRPPEPVTVHEPVQLVGCPTHHEGALP